MGWEWCRVMNNTIEALGMISVDLFIFICTVLIIKFNIISWNKKIRILCVCIGIILLMTYVFCFAAEIKAWHNFNAALFNVLRPWITLAICIIFLWVFLILVNLIERKSSNIDNSKSVFNGDADSQKGITYNNIFQSSTIAITFLITMFICPFYETYVGNIKEFSFSLWSISLPVISAIVVIIAIVIYLRSKMNEKAGRLFLSIIWSVGIISYLQGLFLNGNLFLMDGKGMEWSAYLVIGNMFVWLLTFVILTGIINSKRAFKYANQIMMYSAAFLAIIQLVGMLSLIPEIANSESHKVDMETKFLSTDGIDEIATGENVVMFILDTYDVNFYEEVKSVNENFYFPLNDFIFYPDTISQFSRTYPSVPYMLSHQLYFFEETMKDYVDNAFSICSFWEKIKDKEYSIYIFEDDKMCIGEPVLSSCDNYCEEGHVLREEKSFFGGLEAVMTVGGYRTLPYMAKTSFSYTADSVNRMVIRKKTWDNEPYLMDDARLIDSIKTSGLTVSEKENALIIIHMMGAHAPYVLDINGEEVNDRIVEPVEQYQGCMQYIYQYIDEMKRLGKYDNATIIITADHGKNYVSEELPDKTNPILMIKYPVSYVDKMAYDKESQNGPNISNSKASLEDILPTIASILNIEYDGNGVGADLTGEVDNNRIRYHYFAVVEDTNQTGTLKYEVDGSSRDFNSWKNTGEYHKFGEHYE